MKFETSAAPPMHPAGKCKLRLKSVDIVSQPSFNDPNVMQDRAAWKFISNKKDPETEERYQFTQWTGLKYGNPKATMTGFANMIYPKLTDITYLKKKGYAKPEDCFTREFDSDKFLGKQFEAQIVHGPNQKGDMRAELRFIALAEEDEDDGVASGDDDDPFEDE